MEVLVQSQTWFRRGNRPLTTINFIAASELFMVASSPTRLRVLAALSDRDMMVFELVEATGTESSSLSQPQRGWSRKEQAKRSAYPV